MRLLARNRRNSNRDILEELNQNTSESANDNRPKKRIALDPKDHLYALQPYLAPQFRRFRIRDFEP